MVEVCLKCGGTIGGMGVVDVLWLGGGGRGMVGMWWTTNTQRKARRNLYPSDCCVIVISVLI